MRKNMLFSLQLLLMLLSAMLIGCFEPGSMLMTLEADNTTIKTGETVNFTINIPEDDVLDSGTVKILDGDGQQVELIMLNSLNFAYKFTVADNYQILADVITDNDYGYSVIDIVVEFGGWTPDWSLADNPQNPSSLMGNEGEKATFYLDYFLKQPSVQSIDVRMINRDGDVIFYEKDVKTGFIEYAHTKANKFGEITFVVTVNFNNGNGVKVSDKMVILDPDNPVKILFEASENNPLYPDQIYLDGTVSLVGKEGSIQNLTLVRRAYYGKENGIHALAEPAGDPTNKDDTGVYSHVGTPWPVREERYQLIKNGMALTGELILDESGQPIIDEATGEYQQSTTPLPIKWIAEDNRFTFLDPMPYYAANGSVEETGFKWDYAKFDREAWKYIKRKQHFDIEKAVSVEYFVIANALVDGDVNPKEDVQSSTISGSPYLSTVPMAQFCLWMKEVAMNRIWHMQVPRYCYSKSMSWLTSGQNHGGALSGNVYYSAGVSGGGGAIRNYSDWPGMRIYTNRDISVSGIKLETNVRRSHDINVTVITPIWPQMVFKIQGLGVRDYTLQWGMWITGGGHVGDMYLKRGTEAEEHLNADLIKTFMPTYDGWGRNPGYGYDAWDHTGADHASDATWTKINFKYNPTLGNPVENGIWASKEEHWAVYYDVQ